MKVGNITKQKKEHKGIEYWIVRYKEDVLIKINYFNTEIEADNFIVLLKNKGGWKMISYEAVFKKGEYIHRLLCDKDGKPNKYNKEHFEKLKIDSDYTFIGVLKFNLDNNSREFISAERFENGI